MILELSRAHTRCELLLRLVAIQRDVRDLERQLRRPALERTFAGIDLESELFEARRELAATKLAIAALK